MTLRIYAVTIDCADPESLAAFWAEALGGKAVVDRPGEEATVEALDGGVDLTLLKVPDGKTGKNRLHLDLRPDDQDAEVARLESLGATRADIGQEPDVTWVVMADPEGNEFCVLRPRSSLQES